MPKTAPKTFVLDTNVVLFDPDAIFKLEENNVLIPELVIEEVDHFKSENSERGQNSRAFSRHLDRLAQKGSLCDGVSLGEGKGTLRIVFSDEIDDGMEGFTMDTVDNRILQLCCKLGKEAGMGGRSTSRRSRPVKAGPNAPILITKDTNLRVKSSAVGVLAEDYRNDKVLARDEKSYTGRIELLASSEVIRELRDGKGGIGIEDVIDSNGDPVLSLVMNQFVELYASDSNSKSATLGRFDGKRIVPLQYMSRKPKGVRPRNIGQAFMLEALLQPAEVAPLVIVQGSAGTGKTFLSLAAALDAYTAKKSTVNRVLVSRPATMMDDNLGFLPGSEEEKMEPFMRAIKDNIMSLNYGDNLDANQFNHANAEIEQMFYDGVIKAESLAYQRGRSLNHYWFILDEMQNATIRQAKALITRCGLDTKIVMMGDPEQIDNPYLDRYSNGLTFAAERMKGSPYCWQLALKPSECQRSKLAQDASERM